MKKKIIHRILSTLMLSAISALSMDEDNAQSSPPIKHPKPTLYRNDYLDSRKLCIILPETDNLSFLNHPALTSPHALETDKGETAYHAYAAYFSILPTILEKEELSNFKEQEVSDSSLQLSDIAIMHKPPSIYKDKD